MGLGRSRAGVRGGVRRDERTVLIAARPSSDGAGAVGLDLVVVRVRVRVRARVRVRVRVRVRDNGGVGVEVGVRAVGLYLVGVRVGGKGQG